MKNKQKIVLWVLLGLLVAGCGAGKSADYYEPDNQNSERKARETHDFILDMASLILKIIP